jgi:hypothetical protein
MTVTITGTVTVGGQDYPVQTQITLPDAREAQVTVLSDRRAS